MNAFSLILLSICGIILYGNCLPYREFWSKYKSRDDYYEDYYLKKVPKMKISPQKVKEFLINHLSWFPLDDSQDQRKGSSTQKTYDKRHEITAKPHITHIRKNVTVVHRVHQVTIKEKLTEKFKNFTKDHNMQPNWTAIKNKSTLSLLKLKYFIKQQHFKEKFKNATHPLRYKGTKTRKKNKNKHRGKNGSQCACPTALAHSKGPPVQPVKISTTFLPPPPDFWQIPKIPTELPQSLKEKYSSEKPQIWHTKEDTKMTEIPEFKQKHLTVSAFQIPLGTSPKHPEFSKCVKKPSKSMAIIKFIELTLPKESTEPTNQTEYNKCREPTHVIEPIRPTECTQPMRLAMHTQHARPTPPTQFTIHQKLPEDSIPKHPEMPDPDEFPKYLQPFKNSQTPSVFSQPFNQMAKSVRLKNPHISHVKPQYYNQQKKNSQLPKLIEASPIYIKTSNSKDSLQLPNIIVLPNVPSARFVSPDKIKILIDLKTPKNAKGKKVGRSVNRESSLASLEGDNTNSTHVLETAGEMASDLAGRVTNLWHCVLGSHRIPDTRDVKFFLYTRRNVIQPELLNVNYDLINKKVKMKPFRVDIDCYDLKPEKIADFERISDENREIVRSNHLNIRAPTKILIHGYTGSYKDSRMAKIKDAYLNSGRYNVIQVDWEMLAAPPCYIRVTHHSKFVGETIAQFLNGLYLVGLNMSLVHLIGFSLGAQVAGFTGNNATVVPICRITGLDPALPLFLHTRPSGHLDRLDAKFVDVIHTCGGILAMLDPLGHVDFYPNGGTRQPGCEFSNLKCSHSRAPQYFAESVNSRKKFTGQLCLTWEEYVSGQCDNTSDTSFMGEPCSRRSASGKYYLLTKSKEPFVL